MTLFLKQGRVVVLGKIAENDFLQFELNLLKNRYLIGKISITDLNLALQDKDVAKKKYIQSLRDFWVAYFRIRKLTIFDFHNKRSLVYGE